VTLDSDVEALLKKLMRERGLSFKVALNSSLRRGLAPTARPDVTFPTFGLGRPRVDLVHALRVAAELHDEEIVREMSS
jgi:hypothetical protein